MQLQMKAGD